MRDAKLNFSADEFEVVQDAEFILTKLTVVHKVVDFFGHLSSLYTDILKSHHHLPAEVFQYHAKISKGEQYLSLPYVILDHPRIFDKENVFAIRSFFWWGNFFSITLHVSGSYLQHFSSFETLNKNDWYWCVNDDAWQHHFNEDNYVLLKNVKHETLPAERKFIKLSRKLPLEKWNEAEAFFTESYRQLLQLIS